jgi:hypothetical protein
MLVECSICGEIVKRHPDKSKPHRKYVCLKCFKYPFGQSNWKGGIHHHTEGYLLLRRPQHPKADMHGYVPEHLLVAEDAVGHILPSTAIVHHIDGVRNNNSKSNLLVCQDSAYHRLIHARKTALSESGNVNKRQCGYCHQYDLPENIPFSMHKACHAKYERERKRRIVLVRSGLITSAK